MWNLLLTHTPLLYMTQSFWRDEAFSVLASEQSLRFIVERLGFEPPVYYTLLHYWIRIFGESDIAARSLSLLGFLLTTVIIIRWAAQMYKKHWLSFYMPVFFFLNPMILYYAFEVRTYAWYMFFATATLYAYTNKRWKWFIVAAVLGFYTHVYLLLFLGALFVHWFIFTHPDIRRIKNLFRHDAALRAFTAVGVLMIPWLIKIGAESSRFRNSWYFPVNLQLVLSALGNMFTGYEGTPWYGWGYTAYLSLILAGFALFALMDRKNRNRTSLFILFGALPLAVIIGISFVKPLFVNRYLIPSTIAEVLVIVAALDAIKNRMFQKITAAVLMVFVLWINWWFPPQHPKVPLRNTMLEVNALSRNTDVIMADNALIYLETLYYAHNRSQVFLYNPQNAPFPWYIGEALMTPGRMKADFSVFPPSRTFLVHGDASFEVIYRTSAGTTSVRKNKL